MMIQNPISQAALGAYIAQAFIAEGPRLREWTMRYQMLQALRDSGKLDEYDTAYLEVLEQNRPSA